MLEAARELAPDGLEIEITDLSPIPPYNGDVEAEGIPAPVQALKARIEAADALLFSTPEYNHLMSGVLKNAIDWASRPPSALRRKPAAIMGASAGTSGTARAQLSLRQVLTATECYVLPAPQVLVASARDRFDSNSRLTDEAARRLIRSLLEALPEWIERFRPRQDVTARAGRPLIGK
jgi:chromate reductase, NAD(P)H dehydrogenase (quinone)